MRTFRERKKAAASFSESVKWEAKGITIATTLGPVPANVTGPIGTDWAMNVSGGLWTVHHVPSGRKAADMDCPLVAAMLVTALALHYPRVGGDGREAADFIRGFLHGPANDPNLADAQALVLTALMNRMGIAVFMGDPGDSGKGVN